MRQFGIFLSNPPSACPLKLSTRMRPAGGKRETCVDFAARGPSLTGGLGGVVTLCVLGNFGKFGEDLQTPAMAPWSCSVPVTLDSRRISCATPLPSTPLLRRPLSSVRSALLHYCPPHLYTESQLKEQLGGRLNSQGREGGRVG